ncbi:MAG TPA: helix-turn-helix domain-containing protein [Ktedonobacterales bacterium]|nr:helix-turn-helix domain-containing protein [Ktedonobacterales bacterium]
MTAFAKGYLTEGDLDAQVERIRAELIGLPAPRLRDPEDCTRAAIAAGETLADMAGYWGEAAPEERRDMLWALLSVGGLVYDLEYQGIVGLLPRPDVLPVLALGLATNWEQRDGGLWLRDEARVTHTARSVKVTTVPYRAHRLTPEQREQALDLVRAGQSPQQVAAQFGVSYWVIFRLVKRDHPNAASTQQQQKLTPEQANEARALLAQGKTLRQVGVHFGVSYGAIWRLVQRDRRAKHEEDKQTKGGETG